MTDYKVKGTKLPGIPNGTEYRAVGWGSSDPNEKLSRGYEVLRSISYGSKEFEGEVYILAETLVYTGSNYFMFKESDVIALAESERDTIIGYKLIKEEYREAAIKIALRKEKDFIKDSSIHFTQGSRSRERLEEAGVLNLWFKPVYEEKNERTITDSQDRKAKIINRELHVADGKLTLADLKSVSERYYGLDLGGKHWSVELVSATFDIGCWSGVTLEDINKAIEAIESF